MEKESLATRQEWRGLPFGLRLGLGFSPALGAFLGVALGFARAIALALDADYVGVVDDALDEGSCAHGIGEDGGQVAEEEVGGQDDAFFS
jgi:hypothetical protein